MAFLTMSMAEIFHSFNMRSQRGSLRSVKGQNRILNIAAVVSLICTTLVIEVPFLANAFGFSSIGLVEYVISILLASCIIHIVELVKYAQGAKDNKKVM
jgi:Ca2+-transporting ATPase